VLEVVEGWRGNTYRVVYMVRFCGGGCSCCTCDASRKSIGGEQRAQAADCLVTGETGERDFEDTRPDRGAHRPAEQVRAGEQAERERENAEADPDGQPVFAQIFASCHARGHYAAPWQSGKN